MRSEADSSAVTDDVGFDLFGGPVGDFLFGAGPIKAVQSGLGLGHGDAFHRIALLGDTWGLVLALGVAFWLYGRDTTYAFLGAVALGVGHHVLQARPNQFLSEWACVPDPHSVGVLYMRERLSLFIPALVVLTVSVTRLYLGLHYLADVLFAILVGALFVWAYARLFPYGADWFYRRSVSFYAALTAVASGTVLASIYFLINTARRWEIVGLVLGRESRSLLSTTSSVTTLLLAARGAQ